MRRAAKTIALRGFFGIIGPDEIDGRLCPGEQNREGYKIATEISTVNRRETEVNVYLQRELEPSDPHVRGEISRRIACGRVAARLILRVTESALISHAQVNSASVTKTQKRSAGHGRAPSSTIPNVE